MLGVSAPFIVVSGTIGSGKTTLTRALAKELAVPAFVERPERNPYFGDPSSFALQSELWFLNESLKGTQEASGGAGGIVDRAPEEHLDVFAKLRTDRGWMTPDEHALLESTFVSAERPKRVPDLLIHLDIAPMVARRRVVQRGRDAEMETVDLQYLESLNSYYESFLRRWNACPILRIYSDRLDFANQEESLEQVVQDVRLHLNRNLAVILEHPDAVMPTRKLPGDAGLDLACLADVTIGPTQRATVETGVRMHIPEGHLGMIVPRSSLAQKGITHLDSPGIIDSGYRGAVHLLLLNTDTTEVFSAKAGDRLGQLVIVPFRELVPQRVERLAPSIRQMGGFGSTGRDGRGV